jgi:hypothetical protein
MHGQGRLTVQVTFPATDEVKTMPFAELLPLAFGMKLE